MLLGYLLRQKKIKKKRIGMGKNEKLMWRIMKLRMYLIIFLFEMF